MKNLIKLFVLASVSFSVSTTAMAKNHCVCEIGSEANQQVFFKMGCSVWFKKKKCDSKQVLERNYYSSIKNQITADLNDGDSLDLGYVGHWSSSYQTVRYIEKNILPIVQEKNIDVIYNNTACYPMSNPVEVQDYLNEVELMEGSSIKVVGSQAVTIGLWDGFSRVKGNFNALASTELEEPKYTSCSSMEDKKCSKAFQKGGSGECYDKERDELVKLTCEATKPKDRRYRWTR